MARARRGPPANKSRPAFAAGVSRTLSRGTTASRADAASPALSRSPTAGAATTVITPAITGPATYSSSSATPSRL
ncbi:MAG TPA: hypothetical protein VHZ03_25860 [Trebonia sp.]|nr:hypothetical protein [Trebonia sp.]